MIEQAQMPINERRAVAWLLLVAILIGAFLRLWRLDTMPPGLYHDEAYNGLDALSLIQRKEFPQYYEGWELYAQDAHADRPAMPTRFPLFFEGNYGREPLHIYLMALSIRLFGANPLALRLVPAAAGILAILTTYLAAAALLNGEDWGFFAQSPAAASRSNQAKTHLAPLFAAFAMAILYPAIHFSRFGLRLMIFVPVETLTVYCFWRGITAMRCQKSSVSSRLWFVAAGFLLGLGLYTYAAARLFPLLFVGFCLIWFWRDRPVIRRVWSHILLMAATALLIAAPLLLFFARYPYFFAFRIAYVANRGRGTVAGKPWLTWFNNIGRVGRGLFWQGEIHLRHNLPGRPYLDPLQALAFLAGIAHSLRRWGRPRYLFLILWLLIMLLPTILSGDAPHFGRMSGAAPVIATLVGLGADWLHRQVRTRWPEKWQQFPDLVSSRPAAVATGVLLFFFLVSTAITCRDYFQRYASHPDLPRDFYLPDWQLGQYAAAQTSETNLYLTPTQAEMATIFFALEDPERLRSYNGESGLIPVGKPGTPSLYIVREGDGASLRALTSFFPGGVSAESQAGFVPFLVAAKDAGFDLENLADTSWDGQIKLIGWSLTRTEEQLSVTLGWQDLARMSKAFTAYVHLVGQNGDLIQQSDRPPAGYPTTDWWPGEIIVDHFSLTIPAEITPGSYLIEAGWYYLPTLEPLGDPYTLGWINID